MTGFLRELWKQDEAQDVAEYAVMLAVILAIAVATIRLVGSHAGDVFANVSSAIQ
jgi:Flp pilus assembly pilin Flp